MLNVKNEHAISLLAGFRQVDVDVKKMSLEEVAETLVLAKKMSSAIEEYEKVLKDELIAKKVTVLLVPEHEMKIVWKPEGKAQTVYNVSAIAAAFEKEKRTADFLKIVAVGAGLVKDNIAPADQMMPVIEANKRSVPGNPYFEIRAMSKEDKKQVK